LLNQAAISYLISIAFHAAVLLAVLCIRFPGSNRHDALPIAIVELGESSLDVVPSMALLPSAPARASSETSAAVPSDDGSIEIPHETFERSGQSEDTNDSSSTAFAKEPPARKERGDDDESTLSVVVPETRNFDANELPVSSASWEVLGTARPVVLDAAPLPDSYEVKSVSQTSQKRHSENDIVSEAKESFKQVTATIQEILQKKNQHQPSSAKEDFVRESRSNSPSPAEVSSSDPSDGKNAVNSLPQESSAGAVKHKMGVRTNARLLSGSRPNYPEAAVRNGLQGKVVLEVTINDKGRVTEIRILTSSRHKILDEEALKFAKTVQFEPATLDGISVTCTVRFPISFSLLDGNDKIR